MTDKKVIPKEVSKFLRLLMIEKGNDKLPANIQADIMYDLYVRYNNFLTVGFLREMDPETEDEFGKLIEEKATEKEIDTFLRSRIDYSKVVKEVTADFRNIFLGNKKP